MFDALVLEETDDGFGQGVIEAGLRSWRTQKYFDQPCSVSGTTQTRGPMRTVAGFGDSAGSSACAPVTSLTTLPRNSCGDFLGAGIAPPSRVFEPSTKPGATHPCPAYRNAHACVRAVGGGSAGGASGSSVVVHDRTWLQMLRRRAMSNASMTRDVRILSVICQPAAMRAAKSMADATYKHL